MILCVHKNNGGEIKMKMSTKNRILSIISGVVVFVLLIFVFSHIETALIGGVIGWLVYTLISNKKEKDNSLVTDGLTRADLENTIKTGRKLTTGMREAVKKLSQMEICREVEDLCRIAESMFEMLKKDPNDVRIVKQFITYYLEPTHKIIVKYAELATARPMPAGAVETLERTEKSLKNMRETFLKQKERMLTNDVIDLDTEIKVFETLSGNIRTKKGEKNQSSSGAGK